MMRQRVIAYYRFGNPLLASDDAKNNVHQRMLLEAEKRGWDLISTYIDSGSGMNRARAGLSNIISELAEHNYDVIMVDEMHHISRDVTYIKEIAQKCELYGVKIFDLASESEFDTNLPPLLKYICQWDNTTESA